MQKKLSPPVDNLLSLGADPEVFLRRNKKIVSAIGRIGGTKEAPLKVNLGAVQEDNVLAEFNIDPANDENSFVHNIVAVMEQLAERALPYQIDIRPVHIFKIKDLVMQGEKAMSFGCDPDYNCWTGRRNEFEYPMNMGLRTAAGHVHFGYNAPSHLIAQSADIWLGAASVQLDRDNTRRQLYGKSGAFRPKPYGAEYRVLSNFWLMSEELMRWVYRTSVRAVQEIPNIEETVLSIGGVEELSNCINSCDLAASKRITKQLGLEMP